MELIIASSSPRRKELVKKIWKAKFVESEYKEKKFKDPKKTVIANALGKAEKIKKKFKGKIVVGADTVVYHDGNVLGKPKNKEEAKRMLASISGKWVKIYGGIAVISKGVKKTGLVVSRVKMKRMSRKEIEDYVESGEPLDKAGAFGIQEKGALLVEKIEGDYFNVVGLSLFRLNELLKEIEKGAGGLGKG